MRTVVRLCIPTSEGGVHESPVLPWAACATRLHPVRPPITRLDFLPRIGLRVKDHDLSRGKRFFSSWPPAPAPSLRQRPFRSQFSMVIDSDRLAWVAQAPL